MVTHYFYSFACWSWTHCSGHFQLIFLPQQNITWILALRRRMVADNVRREDVGSVAADARHGYFKKNNTNFLSAGAGISFCLWVLIIKFKFMEPTIYYRHSCVSLSYIFFFFRVGLFYYHSVFKAPHCSCCGVWFLLYDWVAKNDFESFTWTTNLVFTEVHSFPLKNVEMFAVIYFFIYNNTCHFVIYFKLFLSLPLYRLLIN